MENVEKIIGLVKAQQDEIDKLVENQSRHAARLQGFQASLAALNGSQSALDVQVKKKLEAKIAEESDHITMTASILRDSKAKKQALDEVVKLFPKAGADGSAKDLRVGSELAKIRDALRTAGKPLTLDEILQKIGAGSDPKKRLSLRGSLRNYANGGKFFTIEGCPDTFGLLEFKK